MFLNKREIVNHIKEQSGNMIFDIVDCWVKNEGSYNLYIFTLVANTQEDLLNKWERISSDIALHFQGELDSKIEIWNIYLVFLLKGKVDSETRYFIEQNKFSSRKLIIDEITSELSEESIQKLIYEKIFNLKIKNENSNDNTETLEDLLKANYYDLFDLLSKNTDKPSNLLKKYLEVSKWV